jgi:hypothetical protein
MSHERFRTAKAVLKNAILWGALCGGLGGGLVTLWVLFVPGPGVESLPERLGEALFAGIAMGTRFGLAGAIMGTLFALAVRFAFRGGRLAQINPLKFAALGAVVGGVGIPLVYQLLNVLSDGHTIAWNLVLDDSVWASVFGAGAAAGSVWMARRAAALSGGSAPEELGEGEPLDAASAIRERERTGVKA